MLCAECRHELSARLDGEDAADARAAVDAHLTACPSCRDWHEAAARVTRFARTGLAQSTPDLVDAVLAQSPGRAKRRWRTVLRVALALIGLGQLAMALIQILGDGESGRGGRMNGASLVHFAHESAAWNIALGIGFVWIAWRVTRAAGLVPTLTAFVGMLVLLTSLDIAHSRVDPTRLSMHALVLAGYLVVLLLTAPRFGSGGFRPGVRRDEFDELDQVNEFPAATPLVTRRRDVA